MTKEKKPSSKNASPRAPIPEPAKHMLFLAKAPEFLTSILIALILGVFPIYFDDFGLRAILEAKRDFFFYTASAYLILLSVVLLAQVFTRTAVFPPLREIPRRLWQGSNFSQKMIVLLMLSATASTLLSPDRTVSWLGYIRYEGLWVKLLYWAVFLAVSVFGRLSGLAGGALWVSGVFMGVISILQYGGLNPFQLFPSGTGYPLNDITKMYIGTIGNINSTAGFYCLMLPVFIAAIILLRSNYRFLYLLPLLLNGFVLLFIDSKQGIVGVAGGMLLMLPFLLNTVRRIKNGLIVFAGLCLTASLKFALVPSLAADYHPSLNVRMVTFSFSPGMASLIFLILACLCAAGWAFLHFRRPLLRMDDRAATRSIMVMVVLVILAGFGLLLFSPAGNDPANGIFYEAAQVVRGTADDSFGSQRLFIWRRVPQLVREYPLFGSGPDTFGPRFTDAYRPEIWEQMKQDFLFDHAENEYLSLLVNLGFAGLMIYLLALGGEALRWLKRRKTPPRVILGFALLCSSIQLLFTSSSVIVSPVFWVIWGLLNRELNCSAQTENPSLSK